MTDIEECADCAEAIAQGYTSCPDCGPEPDLNAPTTAERREEMAKIQRELK